MTSSSKKYEFGFIDKNYKIFEEKELKDFLIKWNIDKNLKILTFNILGDFESDDLDDLISNFLHSKILQENIDCASLLNEISDDMNMKMEIQCVPCTILSMDFFDRICESGITLSDGTIRKCPEDYSHDIVVADDLREMLLLENSENFSLYDENERNEFIFRVFKHLCLGGILNQYEDNLEPYILMTKTLYKDVVCVRKCGELKQICIKSKVFKISCFKENIAIFPSKKLHEQDFAYIIINSNLKDITLMYHLW